MQPVLADVFWRSYWQAPEHAPYLCFQAHVVVSSAQAQSQSQGSGAQSGLGSEHTALVFDAASVRPPIDSPAHAYTTEQLPLYKVIPISGS